MSINVTPLVDFILRSALSVIRVADWNQGHRTIGKQVGIIIINNNNNDDNDDDDDNSNNYIINNNNNKKKIKKNLKKK